MKEVEKGKISFSLMIYEGTIEENTKNVADGGETMFRGKSFRNNLKECE